MREGEEQGDGLQAPRDAARDAHERRRLKLLRRKARRERAAAAAAAEAGLEAPRGAAAERAAPSGAARPDAPSASSKKRARDGGREQRLPQGPPPLQSERKRAHQLGQPQPPPRSQPPLPRHAERRRGEGAALPPPSSAKAAKRRKLLQALHVADELVTPAEKSGLAFDADWHDHCETPFDAYRHIEPLLFKIAQACGRPKEELRLYDPYFCEGSVRRHLGRLGFPNCYNRNEDFYATVAAGKVPPHDVLITNPPYSGDHMKRILRFAAENGRPWLLLLPNFVYRKRDFSDVLAGAAAPPFFVVPRQRYTYYAPGRQDDRCQATAPFDSFWYCCVGPPAAQAEAVAFYRKKYAKAFNCEVAATAEELPAAVVPVRTEKRPNPKARRRMALGAGQGAA